MTSAHPLRGVFPVVPTPFDDGGDLDPGSLEAVVDRLIGAGIESLLLLGTGGEVGFLTREERSSVVRTAAKRSDGRALIAAGIVTFGTRRAVEEARRLTGEGASALLVALPQYFRTPLSSVVRHYAAICDAVSVPVLYYHYPLVFGLRLGPKAMASLFERVPLAGTKESGLSTPELAARVKHTQRPISVFTGQSFNLVDAMAAGGAGCICPVPVLAPRRVLNIVRACEAADTTRARELSREVWDLLPIISGAKLPRRVAQAGLGVALRTGVRVPQNPAAAHAGVKAALAALGVIRSARTREPQPPLSGEQVGVIADLARRIVEKDEE